MHVKGDKHDVFLVIDHQATTMRILDYNSKPIGFPKGTKGDTTYDAKTNWPQCHCADLRFSPSLHSFERKLTRGNDKRQQPAHGSSDLAG